MVCLAVQVLPIFATRGSLRLIFWEQHNVQKVLRLHPLKNESSVFQAPTVTAEDLVCLLLAPRPSFCSMFAAVYPSPMQSFPS